MRLAEGGGPGYVTAAHFQIMVGGRDKDNRTAALTAAELEGSHRSWLEIQSDKEQS
jgi:hypothetical protein